MPGVRYCEYKVSFPPEIRRYFSPFGGFPFKDAGGVGICVEPAFGTFYQVEYGFVGRFAFEQGLALLLLYPEDGVAAIRIEGKVATVLFQSPGLPLQAASTARLSLMGFPTGCAGDSFAAALEEAVVFR